MAKTPLILRVAVPVPLYGVFDYLAPIDFPLEKLQPGLRVKVPWRRKEIVGILLDISKQAQNPALKLKATIAVIDTLPLFPSSIMSLLKFAADYYQHPIGEVFASALPTLLRQGKESTYRKISLFEALPETFPLMVLTDAQQMAVKTVTENLNQFTSYLLYGVTGSGKTEVYLQIIAQVLAQKKQALVLVPEIGLTPQTVERFQKRFPVNIAVLHSGLTDRERHNAWLQAACGDAPIIIGTRSAIFTPMLKPGVIIIDEEHDLSFKQQDGFRYSARDLAVVRARLEKIPVMLGSATPALESLHNAQQKRYHLLSLPERAGAAVHPAIRVIDLRRQVVQHGLSQLLFDAMRRHLDQKGQVLLFLNRRGYAPTLICHECGWVAECHRCDARMTLHQKPLLLQCHHCGASRGVDKYCRDCQTTQLFPLGAGTERIEEALREHFPTTPLIRIDRDTTRLKGALEHKLASIHKGESSILIGTQMLAKGHHFPEVTLAAILNADSGLFSGDFRGPERAAQLIVQVAGRAGRVEKPGEVILQTYHPEHLLLKKLLEEDYLAFADMALAERLSAGLPPYQPLALLRAEAMQAEVALQFLREVKNNMLEASTDISLLGPVPAPMQKRAGKHRAQLLLHARQRNTLRHHLGVLIQRLTNLKSKQRVRWTIDVDPQEMF